MDKRHMDKSYGSKIASEAMSLAAALLRNGGLVVYPTETFYALGAVPFLDRALDRIFAIKGRPPGNPLPLIASDMRAVMKAISAWPESAEKLAGAFWPGPLTLIAPASRSVPALLHAGTGNVAVRITSHGVAATLAGSVGGLLVSTSANRSGEPPPDCLDQVDETLLAGVDGVLDAGNLPGGLPSTIVDVSVEPPRLVRKGAVEWEAVLGILRK